MAIIVTDARIERVDRLGRPLDQLEVEILPADQCPGDPQPRIVAPRCRQNACQDGAIKAEGLRAVDQAFFDLRLLRWLMLEATLKQSRRIAVCHKDRAGRQCSSNNRETVTDNGAGVNP